MPARFNTPFPEFHDENGVAREGYKLFFFANGTTTKLATYSDVGLSTANDNPMTLDEYGRVPETVFLQNEYYTVVLAEPDADDPPSGAQIVWQDDYVSASDFKSFSIRKTYNGNPNGYVAGTAGSSGVLPTECWDYTNNILYICTTTGNAAAAVWTAVNAAAAATPLAAQGRLTLTSNTPYLTTGVTAGTAVYYTPAVGNLVPIYGGSSFSPYEFSQLTLTLSSSHLANSIYDVFIFLDGSDVRIGTGPAWSSATAGSCDRGTGAGSTELTRVLGFDVNANAITLRNGSTTYSVAANRAFWVGTIFMDSSNGQVTCHTAYGQSRKWGVWNTFNQREINLKAGDSTSSWSYSTATWRASNNASANKVTPLVGKAEQFYDVNFCQKWSIASAANGIGGVAIGQNSTSAVTGFGPDNANFNISGGANFSGGVLLSARLLAAASLGITNFQSLEYGLSSGTFYGAEQYMLLSARYMG